MRWLCEDHRLYRGCGSHRKNTEAPGTGWGIADQESFTARGTVPAFDPTVLTLAEAGGVWLDLTA